MNMEILSEEDFLHCFNLNTVDLSLRLLCYAPSTQMIQIMEKWVAKGVNIIWIDDQGICNLPFEMHEFDLALCSNQRFIDSKGPSLAFKKQFLSELARVALEVRLYPIVDAHGLPFLGLDHSLQYLHEQGLGLELKQVQSRHGQALLRFWTEVCEVYN